MSECYESGLHANTCTFPDMNQIPVQFKRLRVDIDEIGRICHNEPAYGTLKDVFFVKPAQSRSFVLIGLGVKFKSSSILAIAITFYDFSLF